MGLIKEPKNVDLVIKSKPWTDKEVAEFREIMKKIKKKNSTKKLVVKKTARPKKQKA